MILLSTDMTPPRSWPAYDRWGPRRRPFKAEVPVRLWICDVHGVLIDSAAIVRQAFAATAARYGFSLDGHACGATKGVPLLEAYSRLDAGSDPYPRRAFHLAFVRERVHELRAFPAAAATLAVAKAAGIRVGAATSFGEIAEACLVQNGLYPYIDCLVTQEEVKRPKPAPDCLLSVMGLLGGGPAAPLDAVHVGDTVEDIDAGKAAGIRTIGVTYGMSSESEIRSAEPDYVIHSFAEMRTWLGDWESEALGGVTLGQESGRPPEVAP